MNIDDVNDIIKSTGTDKLKQTRPNDAKWCNNLVQYRELSCGAWSNWKFWDLASELDTDMLDFVQGKAKVALLREKYNSRGMQFRLVAIMEVS